jgi:hypothetical protein
MQQPQPQNPYVQPGYAPQYAPQPNYAPQGYPQQPMQPQYPPQGYQQPMQPQPQYQQGVQPNGYFVPQQVNIGEGSQEFRDAYQNNLRKFDEVNRKVKEGINKSEAVQRVKEMSSYKTKVETDWKDDVQGAAINPEMMLSFIENLCVSLQNPQEWLPAKCEKYFKPFSQKSAPIVQALKNTGNTIRKLCGMPLPEVAQPPTEG